MTAKKLTVSPPAAWPAGNDKENIFRKIGTSSSAELSSWSVLGRRIGSPVEFETAEKTRLRYPDGRDLADVETCDTLAGQPTDDP